MMMLMSTCNKNSSSLFLFGKSWFQFCNKNQKMRELFGEIPKIRYKLRHIKYMP